MARRRGPPLADPAFRRTIGAVVVALRARHGTLMENDLVDELRLMIYPVMLGASERLFGETADQRPVRLVETRTVDDLAYLTYESV